MSSLEHSAVPSPERTAPKTEVNPAEIQRALEESPELVSATGHIVETGLSMAAEAKTEQGGLSMSIYAGSVEAARTQGGGEKSRKQMIDALEGAGRPSESLAA